MRQTQERLIGAPTLQRLNAQHSEAGTEPRLLGLLDGWRGRPAAEQGSGPGNVMNLLRLQRGDLRGMDLSRLALRQVYLQGVDAQDASLAGARLAGAVLDEVRLWRAADRTLLLAAQGHTGMVWGVAVSGDRRLVASGGDDGMVRLWDVGSGAPLAHAAERSPLSAPRHHGPDRSNRSTARCAPSLGAVEQAPASSGAPPTAR